MTELFPIDNPVIYDLEVFPGWFEAGFKYQGVYYLWVVTRADRGNVLHIANMVDWANHNNLPLVGFNSNHYDDAVLGEFLDSGGCPDVAYRTSVDIIQNGVPSWKFSDRVKSIDLMPILPDAMSLKKIGVCLGHKKLQELPIRYDKTPTEEEARFITYVYNPNDLDITEKLYHKVHDELRLRRTASIEHGIDMRSKGRATTAEMILLSKLKRRGDNRSKKDLNQEARRLIDYHPYAHVFKPHWWDKIVTGKLPVVEGIGQDLIEKDIPVHDYRLDKSTITNLVFLQDRYFKTGVGGIHSIDSPGCWIPKDDEVLMDIDVSSYYPNLILTNGLYPRVWGPVFLEIFRDIVNERMDAKKLGRVLKSVIDSIESGDMNHIVTEMLSAIDNPEVRVGMSIDEVRELEDLKSLVTSVGKVVANGTYGKTSEPFSSLYDPQVTANTTIPGQLSLLTLAEMLQHTCVICSANTDGIMVLVKKDKEVEVKRLVNVWEESTHLEMEYTYYKSFYQKDVNNYIAIKQNGGKPKQKGFFLDEWPDLEHTPSGNIIATALVKLLSENIPLVKTITECHDINQFILTQNLSSGWESKWNGQPLGRILRFYKSNSVNASPIIKTPGPGNKGNQGVVSQSDSCVPLPDLPEEFPNDVNYSWYIQQAEETLEKITRKKQPGMNAWVNYLKVSHGLDACLVDPSKNRLSTAKVEVGSEDFSTRPEGMVLGVATGNGILAKVWKNGFIQLFRVYKDYPSRTRDLVERDHGFKLIYRGRVPLTGPTIVWDNGEDFDQYYTGSELLKVGR